MESEPFDVARQVFASLELYRGHHASGPGYATHLADVITMLKTRAANIKTTKPNDANFYDTLALAIQRLNGMQLQ
jgi:hypothetical protein